MGHRYIDAEHYELEHPGRKLTKYRVVQEYPGVAKIVRVTGGYAVFDSLADYEMWKNQR